MCNNMLIYKEYRIQYDVTINKKMPKKNIVNKQK